MEGAGGAPGGDSHRCECQRIDGVGHRPGHQALLRQVKGDVLAHGAIRKPYLVAGDLIGHLDLQTGHPQAGGVVHQVIGLAQDADIRRGLRLRGVVRHLWHGEGHARFDGRRTIASAEVKFLDDEALATVQVHRAGMHLAHRAG